MNRAVGTPTQVVDQETNVNIPTLPKINIITKTKEQ